VSGTLSNDPPVARGGRLHKEFALTRENVGQRPFALTVGTIVERRFLSYEAYSMACSPTHPLVLIVDDNQDARDTYAELLLFRDFGIVKARNGMEGFTRACETRPDVIVTDLALPTIDGLEFVRRLRGNERTRDIPVVVVTGSAAPAVQETARQLGCDRLLIKPCSPDILIDEIQRVLATNTPRKCVSTASRSSRNSSPQAIERDLPARTTS